MRINDPYNSNTNNYFICGYFGWYNSGDDAIGYAVLKRLSSINPNAKFTVTVNDSYFSRYSEDFCPIANIKFINFRIIAILKAIVQSDFFIFTGGTHFHDEDQYLLRRSLLFIKYYGLVLFGSISGKKPILLGHGIGPVSKWWSIFLLKRILANSQAIFVRDTDSQIIVETLGFKKKCFLGFDCSAILFSNPDEKKTINIKILGVSLLPAYSIYSKTPNRDKDLVDCVSHVLNELLHKEPGLIIRLFAFRIGPIHSDTLFLERLKKQIIPDSNDIEVILYDGNILRFIRKLDDCDYFIGMRYHSSLFAYLLHKPQIIVDYMGKCRSLAHDIGLSNDALIQLENIDAEHFSKKTTQLLELPNHFVAKCSLENAISRTDEMFELLNKIFTSKKD